MVIELNQLKKSIRFLGFDPTNGKLGIIVFTYLTTLLVCLANITLFVIYKWENIDDRVNGLKAVVFYLITGLYSIVFIFKWDNQMLTIETIDQGHFKFPYATTNERSNLLNQIQRDMLNLNTFWYFAIKFYVLLGSVAPIIVFMVTAVTKNIDEINVETLILPFPFYYPENYKTLLTYLIGYVVQINLFIYTGVYGYVTISESLAAMTVVEGELKLLRLSVHEIEHFLKRSSETERKDESEETENADMRNLKSFSRYIVNHHQYVYRKVKEVTKGIEVMAFILNSGVSIYLCLSIYIIVQKDEFLFKIEEVLFCLVWAYDIYSYDRMGERIATEDENLRRELYYCGWIDKPKWFKNELYIIMTRINKSVEIKPAGLVVLNLRNFAVSVNAAYSYYNVLHNLNI